MGSVVHFEIPTENPEKALDFFKNVFGWTYQSYGEMEYWLVDSGEGKHPGINGAITKKQHLFQNVINTISIDNIEQIIESIKKNGGEIASEIMEVPNVGRVAYFKDPDGNVHGIIQEV
jgi:predicted enzyme related to lactoylglutathione lyase